MNDERNRTRGVVMNGLFKRWPCVPAVGANRVKKRLDYDRIRGRGSVLVDEPIVLGRYQRLSFYDQRSYLYEDYYV